VEHRHLQPSPKRFVAGVTIGIIDAGGSPLDLHNFDLNLLVTLDALLTEKNVTRAGQRMHLSQSAMSGALARLRDFFEDELLVPMGRTMVLTPLAEDLVQPVRDVLLQVQATIATKPRFEPASSARHFSIAVSDYVTSVLMVDFLRELKCQSPSITFELRPVGKRAAEDLESGELDFLIAPEPYVSAVHPKEILFQDTHTCVAWKKNRQVGSAISATQYLTLGHVIVHVGEIGSANYDERVLRGLNHKRNIEVVTPSFDMAPQLVIGTDRIATVATRLACKYAKLLPIKLLPVPIEIPPMVEVLQWHRAHDQDPAHQWLRTQLKRTVAQIFDQKK
jgi:LysR family transcriptional regulator, nod-box dependent transcriptional activator